MEKLASTAKLDVKGRQEIATFAFASALSTPVLGLDEAQVKSAARSFNSGLKKAEERQVKLVDMLRAHVKPAASA